MEEKKKKNGGCGVIIIAFIAIFLFVCAVVFGFGYYLDYQNEDVETYYIYSHTPAMRDGESVKGVQMHESGKLEYVEAENDSDAVRKAREIVSEHIALLERTVERESDSKDFALWKLRSSYCLISIVHKRTTKREIVESSIKYGTDNLISLMLAIEQEFYKFHIIDEDLKD